MSLEFDLDRSQYLTVEEVANLMKISNKTIYSWCSKGYLPCIKLGRLVRINRDEFLARIKQLKELSCSKNDEHLDGSC
jgi:excisionase family DNA binding protein